MLTSPVTLKSLKEYLLSCKDTHGREIWGRVTDAIPNNIQQSLDTLEHVNQYLLLTYHLYKDAESKECNTWLLWLKLIDTTIGIQLKDGNSTHIQQLTIRSVNALPENHKTTWSLLTTDEQRQFIKNLNERVPQLVDIYEDGNICIDVPTMLPTAELSEYLTVFPLYALTTVIAIYQVITENLTRLSKEQTPVSILKLGQLEHIYREVKALKAEDEIDLDSVYDWLLEEAVTVPGINILDTADWQCTAQQLNKMKDKLSTLKPQTPDGIFVYDSNAILPEQKEALFNNQRHLTLLKSITNWGELSDEEMKKKVIKYQEMIYAWVAQVTNRKEQIDEQQVALPDTSNDSVSIDTENTEEPDIIKN